MPTKAKKPCDVGWFDEPDRVQFDLFQAPGWRAAMNCNPDRYLNSKADNIEHAEAKRRFNSDYLIAVAH
jgi:hypothetical protein